VSTGARPRVILADDHPRFRAAAASLLAQSCEVLASVGDGRSAVDAAIRLQPSVAVLDLAMPDIDGFETCFRIRSSGSDARVLFLSNHTGDDIVLEGLARGGSGFVAKPQVGRDLADAVTHVHAGRAFLPTAGLLPRSRQIDRRRHSVQMHRTDAMLVAGVVAFLDSALECGDSIMTVATTAHRQAIEQQLAARGHDLSRLAADGRYTAAEVEAAVDGILCNGTIDHELFLSTFDALLELALRAAVGTPPHVSAFGELAAVLHARGLDDAMLELEQMGESFVATRPISILCSCDTALCRGNGVDLAVSVCHAHETIIPGGAAW
jgi:DNA-binding NarL/FixJ family response regulator